MAEAWPQISLNTPSGQTAAPPCRPSAAKHATVTPPGNTSQLRDSLQTQKHNMSSDETFTSPHGPESLLPPSTTSTTCGSELQNLLPDSGPTHKSLSLMLNQATKLFQLHWKFDGIKEVELKVEFLKRNSILTRGQLRDEGETQRGRSL